MLEPSSPRAAPREALIWQMDLIAVNPLGGLKPWERSGLFETYRLGQICCSRARGLRGSRCLTCSALWSRGLLEQRSEKQLYL